MKNSEIISDALGGVDEKFVSEYTSRMEGAKRAPRARRITAIVAAAALAALLATALIPALHYGKRPSDNESISVPDGATYNTINPAEPDASISQITHVVNGYILAKANGSTSKVPLDTEHELAYAWNINIPILTESKSPDSLLFRGQVIQTDTYCFDREVTVIDGVYVSYDPKTGSTSYDSYGATSVSTAVQRTVVNITSVKITGVMKEDNTTGYSVGDTIRLYSEHRFTPAEDEHTESPDVLTCASYAPAYDDTEMLFAANRIKDNSTACSDTVRKAGLVDGDIWSTAAYCTYESAKNGSYYTPPSTFPTEE